MSPAERTGPAASGEGGRLLCRRRGDGPGRARSSGTAAARAPRLRGRSAKSARAAGSVCRARGRPGLCSEACETAVPRRPGRVPGEAFSGTEARPGNRGAGWAGLGWAGAGERPVRLTSDGPCFSPLRPGLEATWKGLAAPGRKQLRPAPPRKVGRRPPAAAAPGRTRSGSGHERGRGERKE